MSLETIRERTDGAEQFDFDPAALSAMQRIFLFTDGSVTRLLAVHSGKPVRAQKLLQKIVTAANATHLDAASDQDPVLLREIMLLAGTEPCIYARSELLLRCLSRATREALLESDTPIGAIWTAERVEMFREIVNVSLERCPEVARRFGLDASSQLLSRTYLLVANRTTFASITEKFPVSMFR